MKAVRWLGVSLALLALALGVLYVATAERVEVVVLHTHDAGVDHTTRVWIVDDLGFAWLRTGADNHSWLPRLVANPLVDVERRGKSRPFRAYVIENPEVVARVDAATLAKYGWSESLLRALGGSNRRHVAIRLDPR